MKACAIADSSGRAIAFDLAPGQADKLPPAVRPASAPRSVLADRGTTSHAPQDYIQHLGSWQSRHGDTWRSSTTA